MKVIEFLGLGIRVLGIFLFATLLREIPMQIETITQVIQMQPEANSTMTIYASLSLIFLLISLVMIIFPITVAKIIHPRSLSTSPDLAVNKDIFQATAFVVLGVYILSWATPDLVNNIIAMLNAKTYAPYDEANIAYIWNAIITTLVELGIGLYCTLNADGVIKVIRKLRA